MLRIPPCLLQGMYFALRRECTSHPPLREKIRIKDKGRRHWGVIIQQRARGQRHASHPAACDTWVPSKGLGRAVSSLGKYLFIQCYNLLSLQGEL